MNGKSTKLIDELDKHRGKTVFLGVKSSFFFIGPCDEALSEMAFIDILERSYAAYIGRQIGFAKSGLTGRHSELSIAERDVISTYDRDSGRMGEVVIILDGEEFGMFWTRNEYLVGKDVFKRALASNEISHDMPVRRGGWPEVDSQRA